MDEISNLLIYKNVPISICLGKLDKPDQYECIRLLIATRTKDVKICRCGIKDQSFLQKLVLELSLEEYLCQ
jgi:hypothetical protein